MALNAAGYTVSGAGDSVANGNYVPVTGAYATNQGATQYTNGTYFLAYSGGGYWFIESSAVYINSGGFFLYNVAGASSTTNMPITGWGVSYYGTAPAPTFTTISGAAPASAPRLQPRVVVF